MNLELPPLDLNTLSSMGRIEDGAIVIEMTGSADMESVEPLVAHLASLHLEMQRTRTPEVVVDFRRLEFMSSSSLKAFVEWIAIIQDLEPPDRYRIRFRSNPTLRWQKRSLHSLQCFASDLISVQER